MSTDDRCTNCGQLFGNHPNPGCEHYSEKTEYSSCAVCGRLTDAYCEDHEKPVPVCLTEECVTEHDKRAGHEEDEPLMIDQLPPMPAQLPKLPTLTIAWAGSEQVRKIAEDAAKEIKSIGVDVSVKELGPVAKHCVDCGSKDHIAANCPHADDQD